VFFPDPWPKKRHHKRRLLKAPLVATLARKLVAGGYLHAATDVEDYAAQMLAVFSATPGLVNTAAGLSSGEHHATGYAERPAYRPQTKFEARGLKLGHGVWDVVFRRSENVSAP
jgi:tRNA (guanine-N7-)-methyltransferase